MDTNEDKTMSKRDKLQALFENSHEYLTYMQLAELLQVSRRTLGRWVCLGKIPYSRISSQEVRFSRSEIVAWLKQPRGLT